jgi:hypothetical protein
MQSNSSSGRRAAAIAVATLAIYSTDARANSGTQLPLSQFQAGSEQTNNSLITNPGFEQPGVTGAVATGWTNTGNMFVAPPEAGALPNPASAIGNFSAKANNIDINANEMYSQTLTLAPNTDYVLSGYLWEFGMAGPNPPNDFNAGDLAVVQLRDDTNFFNTSGVILERTALDGGNGAAGYFVYKTFNSSQFPSTVTLEVLSDPNESLFGARPTLIAQFDNIALTPVTQFVAQKWTSTGGGNWGDNTKWLNNQANAADAIATFGNTLTGAATITLEAPKTVAVINFDSANSYNIVGTSTLTLAHEEDRDAVLLNVLQGSHSIAAPIVVRQPSDTGLMNLGPRLVKATVAGSTTLTVSNDVISSGTAAFNLTKEGAGRLNMKNVRAGRLAINAGSVGILPNGTAAGRSNVTTLTIAGGATPTAKLDISNNAFVVDYTGAANSPFLTIQAQIKAGYNSGAWTGNGITTSNGDATHFAIGYGEATALASVPAIFGTVDADAVLFRETRYGDATLDGTVNLSDFNKLASNFGQTGKFWTDGDFNYDGNVNLSDFNLLAGNFGLSAAGSEVTPQDWANLAAAVPEPGAALLAMPFLFGRRRRILLPVR